METPAAWHVLMPSRVVRASYPGSDSGQHRKSDSNNPIFQPDGSVNAQIAEKAASTFWSYDTESKGSLDRGDLVCALGDMGAFQGMPPKMIGDILSLDAAGQQDRRYSLHEFLTMYMRLAQQQAKQAREGRGKVICHLPDPPPGAETNPALRQVFGAYCQFARGTSRMMMSDTSPAMVAQQLHRLTQDIGLVGEGGPLYSSSVDIAYVRCQTQGSHRLNFTQWLKAIAILSDESGWDLFRLLIEFAYSLGTKGLPAPVDPATMLPPKPGAVIPALPQLRRLGSDSRLNGADGPHMRASGGGGSDDGVLRSQALPGPASGAQAGRIRPLSGASQRQPRFNNLMSSSNGHHRDYSPASDGGGGDAGGGGQRSLNGEKSWTAFELGQLDPGCLPPWLAQVLDRLQFMEAQAMGERRGGSGAARGPRGAAEEHDALRDTVQSLGQRLQAAEAAAAAAAAACLGAAPPAGTEMATALASLPPWLQPGYRETPPPTNRQLQDMVSNLERQLQAQRQEGEAMMQRLQQLEAKTAAGAGGPGGGGGGVAAADAFGDRLRRCEIRLDGHDAQLARGSAPAAGPSQALEGRVTDLEHHMKTYSVSLLSAATSAASAGECAAAASERSRAAEAAAAAAAGRLEALERRLQERGLVHEPGSLQELQAAAAPTQQQMLGMGLDPRVAEQLGKLPALGLDALVWAEILKRLGKAEQEAREVEGKLSALMAGPAAAAAAGGRPSAVEQRMLDDGLDPKVVEQLMKLSALGMDPLVVADVMRRQGRVELEVERILENPAAAAASRQAAGRAAAAGGAGSRAPSATGGAAGGRRGSASGGRAGSAGKQAAAAGTGRSPAEQQLLDGGMDPKVAEQLGRLGALGVDPGVLADLIKRQASVEQEVKKMAEGPAGLGAEGKAAGSGEAPSAAVQRMVEAGVDPGVAEQLSGLGAVGLDPMVFAGMVQRLGGLEEETKQLGLMRQQLDEARKSDIDQMNDVLVALQQENTDTRNLAAEAQAGGMDAGQRADALTSFAEALAAKHDALEGELREVRGAAGPDGAAGAAGADSEVVRELQAELRQLANALGEVTGRCTAMERDLAMALTSYASIVDLKESENHVLDRHQQLHDEIETLKENVRTVHDEVEQLTTAMVVAAPSIANSQQLPGVVKQSLHMGQGGGMTSGMNQGSNSPARAGPSRSGSKTGITLPTQ